MIDKDGKRQEKLIEIKPHYQRGCEINKVKWEAAESFASHNNMTFEVFTEKESLWWEQSIGSRVRWGNHIMTIAKAECSKCHRMTPKTQMRSKKVRGEGSLGFRSNNRGTRGVSYYRGRLRTVWTCNSCLSKEFPLGQLIVAGFFLWMAFEMFSSLLGFWGKRNHNEWRQSHLNKIWSVECKDFNEPVYAICGTI